MEANRGEPGVIDQRTIQALLQGGEPDLIGVAGRQKNFCFDPGAKVMQHRSLEFRRIDIEHAAQMGEEFGPVG